MIFLTTEEEIKKWLLLHGIYRYSINPDLSVDAHESVNLESQGFEYFPFAFNKIDGYFICSNNNLKTLFNAPKIVGGNFYCDHNALSNLEHAPVEIGQDFNCSFNDISTLQSGPQNIGRHYNASHNCFRNLVGSPEVVEGNFDISFGSLDSLEGSPKLIKGIFYCSHNTLTSVNKGPEYARSLYLNGNPLTELSTMNIRFKFLFHFSCDHLPKCLATLQPGNENSTSVNWEDWTILKEKIKLQDTIGQTPLLTHNDILAKPTTNKSINKI